MVSISKRVAGVGAAVAMIATAGPVAAAGAATGPVTPPALVANVNTLNPRGAPWHAGADFATGPFQVGAQAALGGWNAGADAAVFGWNAGLAALGAPFQLAVQTGPMGVHGAVVAPLTAAP